MAAADESLLLDWLYDILLYSPPTQSALATSANPAPPPGLSPDAIERLLGS